MNLPHRLRQQRSLVPFGDDRPPRPHVVAAPLDLAQHRQAAAQEQLHVEAQVGRRQVDQRPAALEQLARPVHLEAHQLREGRREAAGLQVVVAVAEAAAVLLRQIDAADVEIAAHVLPEVGELQGRADVIGEARPASRRTPRRDTAPAGRRDWRSSGSSRAAPQRWRIQWPCARRPMLRWKAW